MEIWIAHAWGSVAGGIADVLGKRMMPLGKLDWSPRPEGVAQSWVTWVREGEKAIKFLRFDHHEVGERILRAVASGSRPDYLILKKDFFDYGGCACDWHSHPPVNPSVMRGTEVIRQLRDENGITFPIILLLDYYEKDIPLPKEWGVKFFSLDRPREELASLL